MVRTVCGSSQLLGHSSTNAVCPRSFPCAWLPEIALPRATNQCALCSNVHFCDFSSNFCLFFRGGSNMVAFRAKVDRTWQAKFQRRLRHHVTGLRPSGFPNLPFSLVLSFPLFVLQFSLFSFFFSNFSSFHPFPSSLPFSCPFFSHNFPAFFLHLLSLPAFSSIFWSSRHVSLQLPCQLCAARGTSNKRTRHVVKVHFCQFLGIFGHIQKNEGPILRNTKKEGLNFHVIRTPVLFFGGKSDVFKMRFTRCTAKLGPCQQEGPT